MWTGFPLHENQKEKIFNDFPNIISYIYWQFWNKKTAFFQGKPGKFNMEIYRRNNLKNNKEGVCFLKKLLAGYQNPEATIVGVL